MILKNPSSDDGGFFLFLFHAEKSADFANYFNAKPKSSTTTFSFICEKKSARSAGNIF
jgi:hypothetical protein